MRIAVLDAFGGLAGDMFLGATLDLGVDEAALRAALESLGLEGWRMRVSAVQRRHLGATRVEFEIEDQKDHRHLPEILSYIEGSGLSPHAKAMARTTFERLAEAEARAHQIPVERVHFHEVGALDAILDVCGVCFALDALGIEAVYAMPLPAGSGTVRCAHGDMPVPVPAVVNLLGDFELQIGVGAGEMVTPTGAALLRAWGEPAPADLRLRPEASGYGAGTRASSITRLTVGERVKATDDSAYDRDEVWVIESHLDDLTGEGLAFMAQRVMDAGALDVAFAPLLMKKGRPGHALTVMCTDPVRDAVVEAIFEHSTTLGLRIRRSERLVRARETIHVDTEFGRLRLKGAPGRWQPEYEDAAAAAAAHGVPLDRVFAAAKAAVGGAGDEEGGTGA